MTTTYRSGDYHRQQRRNRRRQRMAGLWQHWRPVVITMTVCIGCMSLWQVLTLLGVV